MAQTALIERLMSLDDYRAQRAHVFPSEAAMAWFVKKNRAELAQTGALIIPAGRKLAVVDKFDQAVQTIGERRAKGSSR